MSSSDSKGAAYNPQGLNLIDLMVHKQKTGTVVGFSGAENITNEELLALPYNVLAPAAMESVLNRENAHRIEARLVMECANHPTTPAADMALSKKVTPILPDILDDAGCVVVSYFGWDQNIQRSHLGGGEGEPRVAHDNGSGHQTGLPGGPKAEHHPTGGCI